MLAPIASVGPKVETALFVGEGLASQLAEGGDPAESVVDGVGGRAVLNRAGSRCVSSGGRPLESLENQEIPPVKVGTMLGVIAMLALKVLSKKTPTDETLSDWPLNRYPQGNVASQPRLPPPKPNKNRRPSNLPPRPPYVQQRQPGALHRLRPAVPSRTRQRHRRARNPGPECAHEELAVCDCVLWWSPIVIGWGLSWLRSRRRGSRCCFIFSHAQGACRGCGVFRRSAYSRLHRGYCGKNCTFSRWTGVLVVNV